MTPERNIFFILALGLVLGGCNRLNSGHLPRQKMEDVLMDISFAENYSAMDQSNNHAKGTKNTDSLSIFYKEIFAHHKISQEDFTESMAWYKAHPDELDTLYGDLSSKADKMQADETKKKPL